MKTFLLSDLGRRYGSQPLSLLQGQHPHAWLVWEPGAWTVPREQSKTTLIRTAGPEDASARGGEALALALELPRGKTQVSFGRAESCDLFLNDATLSNLHLVFMFESPASPWSVRDAGSTNGSWLNGVALTRGRPVALLPGAHLQAGQVHLSYYEASHLHARLRLGRLG
jgi:pSer/pThr/pTyr-binding forkhead associated (FHA) protein